MSTPTNPRYALHSVHMELLRRRAVYHSPPMGADEIQQHLQRIVAEMLADGYEEAIIRAVLGQSAELAVREATEESCNLHRARLFEELISLELM